MSAASAVLEEISRSLVDPSTFFALALPAAFAGLVAVLSTIAVERLGGTRGGVLSSIPTTIVPAAIGIWGAGDDIDGFRRAMAFVPIGILLNAGYLVLWRVIPATIGRRTRSHLLLWTVALALGAWLAIAAGIMQLNELVQPSVAQSLVVGVIAFATGIALGIAANMTPHPAPKGARRVSPLILVVRGLAAAIVIAFALILKRAGLPVASGIASVFPVIFTTIMVATWLAQGAHVPTGAVGPMALGTLSVSTYALLAAVLFPLMPIALAALICWIAAISLASTPAYLFLRSRHRQHERMQQQRPSHA